MASRHTHLYGACDFRCGFAFREPFDDGADCLLDVLSEGELRDVIQEGGYGCVLVEGRAEFDEERRVSLERGVEFLAESLCGAGAVRVRSVCPAALRSCPLTWRSCSVPGVESDLPQLDPAQVPRFLVLCGGAFGERRHLPVASADLALYITRSRECRVEGGRESVGSTSSSRSTLSSTRTS